MVALLHHAAVWLSSEHACRENMHDERRRSSRVPIRWKRGWRSFRSSAPIRFIARAERERRWGADIIYSVRIPISDGGGRCMKLEKPRDRVAIFGRDASNLMGKGCMENP